MRHLFNISILVCLFFSCKLRDKNNSNENEVSHIIDNFSISDTTYSNINKILTMNKVVILDKKVPLANINRVIVTEQKIFIFDSEPKIVCYNLKGKIDYIISDRGRGVGEFIKIIDFSVDEESNTLKIYDSSLRKILYYNLGSGKFKYDKNISVAPDAIAHFDNYDFCFNPFSFNYPNSKKYHYSLLKINSDNDIVEKYLPQDPLASDYMFSYGGEFPFFYGSNELLFIERFDNTVYSIFSDRISPIFKIELPNAAPKSYIHTKPNPIDLLESTYSSGISDVYRVKNILYFTFNNSGSFISTFYDLSKNKVVYCGKNIWPTPSNELPVYSPIRGVGDDNFFALVDPSTIIELRKNNESVFPKELLEIEEQDNPVIVFYSVNS